MNEEQLHPIRHSLAHVLAAAVREIYPGAKNAIGPSIEDGFYQDFDLPTPISEKDLPKIQDKMNEILARWKTFEKKEVTKEEALQEFAWNEYKCELINEFAEEGKNITFYTSGDFIDLCKGGHVDSISEIKSETFKLDRVAGAYWRGSEKNKMLTRIYGLAFESKEKLDEYLTMREEAQKRDHRKIGQEQKLFFVDEMVGKGLIMWQPNGTIIRDEIEKFARQMESDAGYVRVVTPHLAKEELFLTSGHLPYYKDDMYPAMVMDDGTYYLKAMNCPHHHIIFRHEHRSYRDLPVRMAEYGTVYRNELSGTLAGLLRVRCLAMNDAHIYCRKDQIRDEFKDALQLTMKYFEIFGLKDYWFRLSLWDPERKDKYVDEPENWNYTEGVLRDVLVELGVKFIEVKDEAAFYGPKVDIQFKSVIGRTESMSTVQLDFIAKKRFELSYVDETGKVNEEIFVIHRAPLSTHERFTAFLIEHYAGIWPTWLAPVQVRIVPVSEKFNDFSMNVLSSLKSAGIRADLDGASDTLGKRIRNAKTEKIPYIIVVGEKEVTANSLTVEKRSGDKIENISPEDFIEMLNEEISTRKS